MKTIVRPSDTQIREHLDQLADVPLTFDHSEGAVPAGFVVDQFECEVGRGESVFQRAGDAIREWAQFPATMCELISRDTPIEVGQRVAVIFRAGPLCTINPARIVEVFNNTGSVSQFGFSYATLPGHIAHGRERFLVEWNRETGIVRYSIRAVSRIAFLPAWLAYPFVRFQQARFRKLSCRAVQAYVEIATSSSRDN